MSQQRLLPICLTFLATIDSSNHFCGDLYGYCVLDYNAGITGRSVGFYFNFLPPVEHNQTQAHTVNHIILISQKIFQNVGGHLELNSDDDFNREYHLNTEWAL